MHAGTLAAIDLSTVSGTTHNDFVVSDEPPARSGAAADAVVDAVVDAMVNPDSDAVTETGSADAGSGRPLDGTVGADEPVLDLRVKTTSGDVRLRRAGAV